MKKNITILSFLLILLCCSKQVTTVENLNKLKTGMSFDQVVGLIHCKEGSAKAVTLDDGVKAIEERDINQYKNKIFMRICRIRIPPEKTNNKARTMQIKTIFTEGKLKMVTTTIVGPNDCIPFEQKSGSGSGGVNWCKENE